MTDPLCFLDGDYLPLSQARINVLDRGFIFGDGAYDVAPVYAQRLFRFDEHIARLQRSLAAIRIALPVTRGVAPRDHVMPAGVEPTVFMMSNPMRPPSDEQRRDGVACVSARDFRWERGDIKSTSLLGNVLARQISADQGALETIMFRDGFLTEASASNVWVVRGGTLMAPPKSMQVLEGIRMELLRELSEECGVACLRRPISQAEVLAADELMLSSATKEVLPVTLLDGRPVGHGALRGKPGPVYARLHEAYQRAKATMSI